ncbi:MAG: site-specific DNA-methyltransferase [Candidatus Hatepunaea meridiana]|nr:site-specific DNA-methyltransferase [Candidatus Hatepunaea meridiana]
MNNTINIINQDALSALQEIKTNSVDLIIADPPYNLGKDYGNNHDLKGFDEYLTFSLDWLKSAYRVLSNDGTIYVFMGVRFVSYLFDILDQKLGMYFNSWITWHYTQGMGKKKGFSPRHDDILMFNKSAKFRFNLDSVRVPQKYFRRRNNMTGANPGDVWEFSHIHYSNPERENHPTQKPEALIQRVVLASSNKGDLVLDPFAGSGTTLRVCQQLDRNCIGIELNPEYVILIKNRLKERFIEFDSIDPRTNRIPRDLPNRVDVKPMDLFGNN